MVKEDIIQKWLNGSLNDAERKEFEQNDAYKSIHRLSDALNRFKAPEYDIEAGVAALSLAAKPKAKVVPIAVFWPWMQVAAVLMVLFGTLFYWYAERFNTTQTAIGQTAVLFLPDSSKVTLNAVSQLKYTPFNWLSHREVLLDGEAYFEVARGMQFDVITEAGTTSVLGTKFNVKHRDGYFEAFCFEGSVQVKSSAGSIILKPGQGVQLMNGKMKEMEEGSTASPGWTHGQSDFQSVPLQQVIHEFERQYHKTILTEKIDLTQLYTGTFVHNNESLALQAITIPMNLSWKTGRDNTIILSATGE